MNPLQQLLERETTNHVSEVGRVAATPGAAVSYSRPDRVETLVAGHQVVIPSSEPVTADTTWDLASLTKLYTATLAAIATERGYVEWSTPLADVTEWQGDESAQFIDLVEHVSGLPAWEKFYEELPLNPTAIQAVGARAAIRSSIARHTCASVGTHRYSDLGYLLLGFLLEDWFGAPLDRLLDDEICAPLGLANTGYAVARPTDFRNAAATEWCSRRGRWVRGTVHDENCDVLGGIAGHAGIFATVDDVRRFGEGVLSIAQGEDGILKSSTLQSLWAGRSGAGHHRGGWDTPSGPTSSVGSRFPHGSTFGHLGFTGTSLWVETSTSTVAVLLTNRVHPSRENDRIKSLRIAVHDAVWGALEAGS